MAVTNWKRVGAAATESYDPWFDDNWVNPGNIATTGEASITSNTFDSPDQSYILKGYTSGYTTSDVPSGSRIVGIEIKVNARYAGALVSIDFISPLDDNGSRAGTNQASTPTALTTTATDYTFGGATNLCGYTTITDAIVRSTGFGAALGMKAGGSNGDVYVDYIETRVYYEPPVEQSVTENTLTFLESVAIFIPIIALSVASTLTFNEVVTVEAQSPFQETLNLPTVSDTLTISELAGIALKACIYFHEEVWIEVAGPTQTVIDLPVVTDILTISETSEIQVPELYVSVTDDTLLIGETVTPLIANKLAFATGDVLLIAESVTVKTPTVLLSPVLDTLTLAEEVTVQAQVPGVLNLPTVADNLTIAEVVTLHIPELFVEGSDTLTIAEQVGVSVGLLMVDSFSILESVWIQVLNELPVVADTLTIAESVSVLTVVEGEVNLATVVDTLTIAESAALHIPTLFVSGADTLTIAEEVTVQAQVEGVKNLPTVEDTLIISELVTLRVPELFISVSETLLIAESVTKFVPVLPVSVTDDRLTIAESVTVQVPTASTVNLPSVEDILTFTEQVTLRLPQLFVTVTDGTLTISESVTAHIPELFVSVTDDKLTIAEVVAVSTPEAGISVVDDTLTIAESVTVQAPILLVSVTEDRLTIAESVLIAKPLIELSVADTLTIAEQVWLTTTELSQSVTDDTLTIAEFAEILVDITRIEVGDTLTFSEGVLIERYEAPIPEGIIRYVKTYKPRYLVDAAVLAELRNVDSEFLRVSQTLRSITSPGAVCLPRFDIRDYGANTVEDSNAFQDAAAAAYAAGGGLVIVPPGIWTIDCPEAFGYLNYRTVPAYSNVWYWGLPGSVIRFKDSISTAGSSKNFTFIGDDEPARNIGVFGIEFDFNAQNNACTLGKHHAIISFSTDNARGEDITIAKCKAKNQAAGNIIVTSSATSSPAYVLGKRWHILGNTFEDVGLSVTDHSCIWGWARDVIISDNRFYQSSLATSSNVKCAAELHGSNGIFRHNHVENFSQMVWVAPNFSESVENLLVEGNTSYTSNLGVKFYRAITGEPAVNQPIRRVKICNNHMNFADVEVSIGVDITCQASIEDVEIMGNSIRKASGSYAGKGIFVAAAYAGEAHDEINVEHNYVEGMHRAIYGLAETSLGTIQRMRVVDNRIKNLLGSYPIGILFWGQADGVHLDDVEASNNSITNNGSGSTTDIGIDVAGYINVARIDHNHFKGLATNTYYSDLVLSPPHDHPHTAEGDQIP